MVIMVRRITGMLLITATVSATGHSATITAIPIPIIAILITITDISPIEITVTGPGALLGKEVPGEGDTGGGRVLRIEAEDLEVEGKAVSHREAAEERAVASAADDLAWAHVAAGADIEKFLLRMRDGNILFVSDSVA